jgi:hypothetical protein
MADRKKIDLFFAVVDACFGVAGLAFFIFGPLAVPYLTALPFFSTEFLISIALPAFILLAGIASLARAAFAPMTSLFASFVVVVNSLAALFSTTLPLFIADGAPAPAVTVVHYILPTAAAAYYCLRGIAAFLESRRVKEQESSAASPAQSEESYCAACGERLRQEDDVCPSCEALIYGRRCASCGHEARDCDFIDGHCPRCNARNGTMND